MVTRARPWPVDRNHPRSGERSYRRQTVDRVGPRAVTRRWANTRNNPRSGERSYRHQTVDRARRWPTSSRPVFRELPEARSLAAHKCAAVQLIFIDGNQLPPIDDGQGQRKNRDAAEHQTKIVPPERQGFVHDHVVHELLVLKSIQTKIGNCC
jgi:hypothetical protein